MNEVNDLIERFSQKVLELLSERTMLTSSLIPVHATMALGFYNLYEKVYDVLKEVRKEVSFSDLGTSGRRINAEINQKVIFSVVAGYLMGREQRLIDGTIPDLKEDRKRLEFVFDFYRESISAYRKDDFMFITDSGANGIQILSKSEIKAIEDEMVEADENLRKRIKRMMAFLHSYLFIANSESRGGIFNHGPYKALNGEDILFREFIHLRRDSNVWVSSDISSPVSNMAVVLRMKDIDLAFNEAGTVFTDPQDYMKNVTGLGIYTVDNGKVIPLDFSIADKLSTFAEKAQVEYFHAITKWDERKKVRIGGIEFSSLLRLKRMAGIPEDYKHGLVKRSEEIYLDKTIKMGGHPLMKNLAEAAASKTTTPIFSRV